MREVREKIIREVFGAMQFGARATASERSSVGTPGLDIAEWGYEDFENGGMGASSGLDISVAPRGVHGGSDENNIGESGCSVGAFGIHEVEDASRARNGDGTHREEPGSGISGYSVTESIGILGDSIGGHNGGQHEAVSVTAEVLGMERERLRSQIKDLRVVMGTAAIAQRAVPPSLERAFFKSSTACFLVETLLVAMYVSLHWGRIDSGLAAGSCGHLDGSAMDAICRDMSANASEAHDADAVLQEVDEEIVRYHSWAHEKWVWTASIGHSGSPA